MAVAFGDAIRVWMLYEGPSRTGDRHLLSLGSVRGIRIQRVSEFLAAFQSRER